MSRVQTRFIAKLLETKAPSGKQVIVHMPAARMGLFTVQLLPADRFEHIDSMLLSAFFRTGLFGIEPVSAFHYSIHIDPKRQKDWFRKIDSQLSK